MNIDFQKKKHTNAHIFMSDKKTFPIQINKKIIFTNVKSGHLKMVFGVCSTSTN